MLDKTENQRKRLAASRADLEALEAEMISMAATEAAASKSADGYRQWRADRDNQTIERERLATLIGTLEEEIAGGDVADAEATLRKRHAEKFRLNAALAKQIRQDLERVNEIALKLMRAVA